ncbi:MAG TPA: hypothetical protein VF203_12545 [Burkholderiales bacterium]
MDAPGLRALGKHLPGLRQTLQPDLVIANGENSPRASAPCARY